MDPKLNPHDQGEKAKERKERRQSILTSGPKGVNAAREVMMMTEMMLWTMIMTKKEDLSEKAYLRVAILLLVRRD